jgi:tetratricopeptide (TPR) repeat protein
MPKQDFLMRMLEQLRGLLPYILDLARSGNYEEAHAVIDQAVRELVGIGTDGVVLLPEAVLLDRLRLDESISWEDKCLFLASVLFEEGKVLEVEGQEAKAYGRYTKALNLLLILALQDKDFQERSELIPEIETVLASLADFHLTAVSSAYLLEYYEKVGEFAAAEDVLYDWLEMDIALSRPDDPNALEIGLAFYGRLQTLTDSELEAGNFSRAEVTTAVADLTDY